MEDQWYYVEAGERKGPVDIATVNELIANSSLGDDDYVWKKGFENWAKIKDREEFQETVAIEEVTDELPSVISAEETSLTKLALDQNSIFIKIGADRGKNEVEYGPYSLDVIRKLFKEHRINGKTYIFVRGMSDWKMLAEVSDFTEIFEDSPPSIDDADKRLNLRKPFIARMYIESNKQVYVGVCRDISVGGMQVLVDHIPANIGEDISINVHPENTEHHFVAGGRVVRLLDGGQGFSFRFTELGEEAKEAIQHYLANG
ncbi:MAG: hypothetical protein ACJAS4_003641 [Bacteriovoracaceae bacterium]|jgi:hypothetical protein